MTAAAGLPWYRPVGQECLLFEHSYDQRLPILLKGPTGCGKSRLVEHMAARLGRPLVTVSCHDETSAVDLLGRWLVRGAETIWQDGPVTRAVREGAILYLDEIAEARPDVVVVLHPLTDHRRRTNQGDRDSGLRGSAWPRRDQDGCGTQGQGLFDRHLVIAHDRGLGAELPQVLDQVPGKGVVVVEDEDHGRKYRGRH